MALKEIISQPYSADRICDMLELDIREHARLYYMGIPDISDAEFDEMVDYLRRARPDSEILKMVGWGSGVENISGSKVEHKYQLIGSLPKCKTWDDIPKDIKWGGDEGICVSGKIDGLSLVCYFENGVLVGAVTRGNGTVGIDRTDKLLQMKVFKQTFPIWFTGAIRGEIVISNENWSKICELHSSDSDWADSHHPRNYAAGIFNRNEIDDEIKYLNYVVYDIIGFEEHDGYKFDNQEDVVVFLEEHFNDVVPALHLNVMYEDTYLDILSDIRDKFNEYPIDGLVLTLNNLGYSPDNKAVLYNQVAFKFDAEEKETTIRNIVWTLTRTNRMVPVAEIEPVFLSGAKVSRVTCNNAKYVRDNKLNIGAVVRICRSNEVIPKIMEVISGCDQAGLPDKCPVCQENLKWDGTDLVCDNPNCRNNENSDFLMWISSIGNIDGIGETLKLKFFDELSISTVRDIYENPAAIDKWHDMNQSQRKLFTKVLDKLLKDPVDPVDALCSLNIPRLGRSSAEKIVADSDLCRTIFDGQYKFDDGRLAATVGNATAESIRENGVRLSRLIYVRDRVSYKEVVNKSELIKVCVTGKLSCKRSDFEKWLVEHGYVNTGIGKDTFVLITDDPNGSSSKNKKANELGIRKMSESEFRNMVNS